MILNSQHLTNLTNGRNDTKNISLQVDSRGFPHIVWTELKNGFNEVHYKYWDGLKWAFEGTSSLVGNASLNSISSQYSLVIGTNDKPFIIWTSKTNKFSNINISTIISGEFVTYTEKTETELVFIGGEWAFDVGNFSSSSSDSSSLSSSSMKHSTSSSFSSSSSSLAYTSLSSSYDHTSSSSSQSSSTNSSSSSSTSSSSSSDSISSSSRSTNSSGSSPSSNSTSSSNSSSSIDSNSSSSSSSYLDSNIIILAIDINNNAYLYNFDEKNFLYISQTTMKNQNVNMSIAGNNLFLTYTDGDSIYSRFFNFVDITWTSNWIEKRSDDAIKCFASQSYNIENEIYGVLAFGCENKNTKESYVKLLCLNIGGDIYPFNENEKIYSKTSILESTSVSMNLPIVLSILPIVDSEQINLIFTGMQNELFSIKSSEITRELIEIPKKPILFNPNEVDVAKWYDSYLFIFNGNHNIYYYESSQESQTYNSKDLTLLSSDRLKFVTTNFSLNGLEGFKDFELEKSWNAKNGAILRESIKPTIVLTCDNDDPCFESSTSSDSSNSSSSSSSSDNLRCLLTWELRYDCESGWQIAVISTDPCYNYDPEILVDSWIEHENIPGDRVVWRASKWFNSMDECFSETLSSISSNSSSQSQESKSSNSSSSESIIRDACWFFHKNDYPIPLPNIPSDFYCNSSSSSSNSSSESSASSKSSESSASSMSSTSESSHSSNLISTSSSDSSNESDMSTLTTTSF